MENDKNRYPVVMGYPNLDGRWLDGLLLTAAVAAFGRWVDLFLRHVSGAEMWLLIAVVAFGFWRLVVLMRGPWISENAEMQVREPEKLKTRR